MSFGYGISDGIALISLAWSTYDGAKKACSEHNDLTREIHSLCTVLQHLQQEVQSPDSLIHQAKGNRRRELQDHIQGCERQVRRINAILIKFNSLDDDERSATQLWDRVRFGNGGVKDVSEIRQKIAMYSRAISISLHLLSQGSQGKIERMIDRQGGEMKGIRESINLLLAKSSPIQEGSISNGFTEHSQDDIAWWRTFRRNLIHSGYKSKVIRGHMNLIEDYVEELCERGAFDDKISSSRLSVDSYAGDEEVAEVVELPGSASLTMPSIKSLYAQGHTFEYQNMSEMAQRITHLEKQLQQAITLQIKTAKDVDEIHSDEPSDLKDLDAGDEHRPISLMTDLEAESMSQQAPYIATLGVAEFLSMAERGFVEEGEDRLDKENLVKARTEAFSALPAEERKKILTLRDTTEKKYLFPYYLAIKWEGMRHLLEQALLDIEGLGEYVTKGEYDLINSDGAVIIPQLWEAFVEPDMEIAIKIRLAPKPPPSSLPSQEVKLSPLFRPQSCIPPHYPVMVFERHAPGNRSDYRSYLKSASPSTSSSIKSSSTSSSKLSVFLGFKGRPKQRKRTRSRQTRPPPPPPGWHLSPPYTPPLLPLRAPLYTYSIPLSKESRNDVKSESLRAPLPTKHFGKAMLLEPKFDPPGNLALIYPTTNEEGAPVFELE